MRVTQVYDFLNTALADTGRNVTLTNTTDIVSLGEELSVASNEAFRDNFFKSLVDRIGRTVIEGRKYVSDHYGIRKEPFEYGAMLAKIHTEPLRAQKNNSYDLKDGDIVNPGKVYKAEVKVKLFNQMDTWEVPVTIVRKQIRSAFLNEETLSAFISSIFEAVENSMQAMYEKLEEYAFCTMIANALNAVDDEGHKYLTVNLADIVADAGLLPVADDGTDVGDTEYVLSYIPALIRIIQTINSYAQLMERMTSIFNSAEYTRFTPKDRQRLVIHNRLASSISSVLKSQVFNKDELKLPDARIVPFWQSFANEKQSDLVGKVITAPSEDMAIKITHNAINDGASIENDCVLAVLYDDEAIATTIEDRRVTTDVIGASEMTNYYNKAEVGYIIDPTENCVVFVWNFNGAPSGGGARQIPVINYSGSEQSITVDGTLRTIESSSQVFVGSRLVYDGSAYCTLLDVDSNSLYGPFDPEGGLVIDTKQGLLTVGGTPISGHTISEVYGLRLEK